MSESSLRQAVCKCLKPLDAQPVENRLGPGYPDVCTAVGMLELKQHDKWPARGGPLRLSHDLTKEQRIWIKRRIRAGGRVWVLIQVEQDFILLEGRMACEIVGEATKASLISAAVAHWETKKAMMEGLPSALTPA